jgi:hypothetical protein
MGGGLLQLVAYGAQDVYLTGNPQVTFFKVIYRRHTNFAMEAIQQSFSGNPGFGKRVTCQIARNGDLIHRMWLQIALPYQASVTFQDYAGLALLKNVELEIGGQKIDKQYPEWMLAWNLLTLDNGKMSAYQRMVGQATYMASSSQADGNSNFNLYVPLEFWFCRNVGLALPLIALQYHDVKVNIEFDSVTKVTASGSYTGTPDVNLWVDYIYLDTDERRRFAQMSHEYLVEQLQFTGTETVAASSGNKIKLNLNHPIKHLCYFVQALPNEKFKWYSHSVNVHANCNPITSAKLLLNGQDRFAARDGLYFSLVQPFQHHTTPVVASTTATTAGGGGINVYSFAIKPEEHQPSGTLNFSRIDTAVLQLTSSTAGDLHVYALGYNVLRVMSGMAGQAYSN